MFKGNSVDAANCPGDATETFDCVPNVYVETCNCNERVGTVVTTCVPGSNLAPSDTCEVRTDRVGGCNNQCPAWASWESWTVWLPSCVDSHEDDGDISDTIFNDFDKHLPKRSRERHCTLILDDGTEQTESVGHVSGNCRFEDKLETEYQSVDDYTKCESNTIFPNNEDTTLIETKVIVDFKISIYEPWTPALLDTTSATFIHLSELYIHTFVSAFATINTDTYKFATLRVKKFTLLEQGALIRRKRAFNDDSYRSSIEAEMESVFNVLVPSEATVAQENGDNNVDLDLAGTINAQAEEQIKDIVKVEVEKKISEVASDIVEGEGDYRPGELNFFRKPVVTGTAMESDALATYSTDFTLVCNCETKLREDYRSCIPAAQDRDVRY